MPPSHDGDLFGQSGSCDPRNDFFDQFLTFDPASADSPNFADALESTVLVRPINGVDSEGTSSDEWGGEARHSKNHSQLMRGARGEPGSPHNAALPRDALRGKPLHSQESGRAFGPEDDLLGLERVSLESPRVDSLPSSPNLLVIKPSRGRRQFQERISKASKKYYESPTSRKSSPIRKATCPPKMMHRSTYSEQNLHDWERLARDAQKFDFGFQTPKVPLSPPPSARVSDSSDHATNMMQATQHHNTTFAWDHPFQQQFLGRPHLELNSPLMTPPSDQLTFNQVNVQATDHNPLYESPRRSRASTTWAQTPIDSDFAFETSTPYVNDSEQLPLWWANAATAPLAEPTPSSYHRLHHHDTKSLALHLQAELAYNATELALSPSSLPTGLMIHMPQSPSHSHIQPFTLDPSPMGPDQQGYFAPVAPASHQLPSQPQSRTQHQPPNYPTKTSAAVTDAANTSQPHVSYAPPKIHRCDDLQSHDPTTAVSKSSSPSPRTRASSFHVTKRRAASCKMHAVGSSNSNDHQHRHASRSQNNNSVRAPRNRHQHSSQHRTVATSAAKSPAVPVPALAVMADFVNFTPSDSRKILTGVAPSGSSKTKARREKEALLEKRRLSQAAVRAVQRAGGDLESLEGLVDEEGLEGLGMLGAS